MSTTISVTKENIKKFFEDNHFLIPEYQRPYAWETKEIETLFEDLTEFVKSNNPEENEYFLGAIVYYNNPNGEREIIDGHQRIVSLMLLFSAIYTKLSNSDNNKQIERFKGFIESVLWKVDANNADVDQNKTIISSEVINDQNNNVFQNILVTGEADNKADDLYSKNYIRLKELYEEYCKDNPLSVYDFIKQA